MVLDKSFLIGTLVGVVGYCVGATAIMSRHLLLNNLSESLPSVWDAQPQVLNITDRARNANPNEFQEQHCTVGVLKRKPPIEYEDFANAIDKMEFEPITFTVDSVSLVHTRSLSYAPPHEGSVDFKLSEMPEQDDNEILSSLHFA